MAIYCRTTAKFYVTKHYRQAVVVFDGYEAGIQRSTARINAERDVRAGRSRSISPLNCS